MQLTKRKAAPRVFSHSEISSLSTCEVRHDLSYSGQLLGHTLTPKIAAPILRDGRAWGAAIAAWHQTGDKTAAMFAMNESLQEDVDEMKEAGVFSQLDYDEQYKLLEDLLDHYIRDPNTSSRIPGDRPEMQLLTPIPSRSGKGRSNRYLFDARLDLVHTDEHGRDWIVEFKLRGQLTKYDLLVKQQQPRRYAWAWRALTGREIVGVIVDERLKAVPKPPRLVQVKKQSERQKAYKAECKAAGVEPDSEHLKSLCDLTPSHAVDQMCEAHEYEALCMEYGVETDRDTYAALNARQWSQRHRIFFTKGELDTVGRQLVSAGKKIHDADAGVTVPIPNPSQMNCGGCPFKEICMDLDNTEFIDSQFDRRPARHERKVAA